MASLDSLPADQKAVLSLVLQRGRSFDEIAAMLSINRAAVRQRALEGFDALGPDTTLEPLKRALITDYLLGQLPSGVATSVRNSLAENPPERAWARIIASEVAPLAANPLPEIPSVAARAQPSSTATPASASELETERGSAVGGRHGRTPKSASANSTAEEEPGATPATMATGSDAYAPRSSRRGGAILLGLIALVVVVVVVVLLVTGGSSKKGSRSRSTPTRSTAQVTPTATTGTGTSTAAATPLHQINLISPTSIKGREGAADVVRASGKLGIVLVAEGLIATAVSGSHRDAYGVWLYNSKSAASTFLGFYGQPVTGTGKAKGELEAEVKLPANATRYNQLLLTLETAEHPKTPGTIVLEGTFAE